MSCALLVYTTPMIQIITKKDIFGNIVWLDDNCTIPKTKKIITSGKDSSSDRQDTRESDSKAR